MTYVEALEKGELMMMEKGEEPCDDSEFYWKLKIKTSNDPTNYRISAFQLIAGRGQPGSNGTKILDGWIATMHVHPIKENWNKDFGYVE